MTFCDRPAFPGNTHFSATLRNLSKEYYQNLIGCEDYRAQRKDILDKIDEEFIG